MNLAFIRCFILELYPYFFRRIFKIYDLFTDQLARFLILCRHTSLNEYLCVRLHQAHIPLIIPWEHHDFHSSHEILQGEKRHNLVCLCILYCLIHDHTAADHLLPISYMGKSRILIGLEVRSGRCDILPPALLVFLQRMAADIYAQHFLLKGELHLLRILSHIRKLHLKFLLLFLPNEVEEAHLTADGILILSRHIIHDLQINHHKLAPCASQPVERAGLDKVLNVALIDILAADALQKIAQRCERTVLYRLLDRLHDRLSNALDRGQAVADGRALHRKYSGAFVYIRRQNLYSHLPAVHDILGDFSRIFNTGCHQSRHEFHRIIALQIRGLIRHDRVRCRMRLIERILRKVDHLIVDLIRHFLVNAVGNTAGHALLRISVDEIAALLLHHRSLLLRHGAAHQITPAKRITAELAYDLHNLLLIDNTSVGRLQDRLQLRAVVHHFLRMILTLDILRNKVHRSRPVQGNSGNDILEILRL